MYVTSDDQQRLLLFVMRVVADEHWVLWAHVAPGCMSLQRRRCCSLARAITCTGRHVCHERSPAGMTFML